MCCLLRPTDTIIITRVQEKAESYGQFSATLNLCSVTDDKTLTNSFAPSSYSKKGYCSDSEWYSDGDR